MGDCETYCQLCGVSFAIARLRTKHEAESAAWGYQCNWMGGWVSTEFLCGEGSGCELFKRATTVGTDDDLEHLAGPGCSCVGGYSGHQISVQEMKGCRAIQCLLSKHMVSHWKPEPDDQDFENETGYFLTGVGDGSATDGEFNQAYPVRHGVTEFWAINSASEGPFDESGFPFHPTCFEIFKLLSNDRFGKVDINGLVGWRELISNPSTPFTHDFVPSFAVQLNTGEYWKHERGSEYLVANPIAVPGLAYMIDSCKSETDLPSVRFIDSMKSNPTDHFSASLPADLLDVIISLNILSSKDITNMRLVSRTFSQLPNWVFRQRLQTDMPWFFEASILDPRKTNWEMLYKYLKVWQNIKGLQNRKRIWKDVTEIVNQIEGYRKQNKIADEYMIGNYATWRN